MGQSAKELLVAGRVDEAIGKLRQQTMEAGDSSRAAEDHNLLCRAYFMLEDWDHGIAECQRAVALDPGNGLYHLWLGRVYGEKADRVGFFSAAGFAKKVHAELERAVVLSPQNLEARADLAEFYLEAPSMFGGGKDKCRAQAAAIDPLSPALAHYVLGRIAEKNKDSAAAEHEFRAAIEASNGAHEWLSLAQFYRHQNRLDEMEDALRTMELRPVDQPESLLDGAAILLRTNRDPALGAQLVRKYLAAPVEQAPAFRAHYVLGQLLERQGDIEGAAEQYRAALSMAHEFKKADEALRNLKQ